MRSNANLRRPLFYDVTRLIESLEGVMRQYLKKRFEVPLDVSCVTPISQIIQTLSDQPNYYRDKNTNVAVDSSSYWAVAQSGVHYIKAGAQYVDDKVRSFTSNDGKHRLGTIGFLHVLRDNLIQIMALTDLDAMRTALHVELRIFFDTLTLMMESKDKCIFHKYHDQYYMLYGLANHTSELKELIQSLLLQDFNLAVMIKDLDVDIAFITSQQQEAKEIQQKLLQAEEHARRLAEEGLLLQQILREREPDVVDEDPAEFSDRLVAALQKHKTQEERKYPVLKPQVDKGCTSAQLHVIFGRNVYLKELLELDPSYINSICIDESKNGIGKRSLCELALFDNKREGAIDMLALILNHRPYITCPSLPVLDQILNRMATEVPDVQLCGLFFRYVIAQKTCTADARAALRVLLDDMNELVSDLSNTQLNKLVAELQDPVDYCRLLATGYLDGDFKLVSSVLEKQDAMIGAEFYEVMWSAKQRQVVDQKQPNLLRYRLEEMLKKFLNICYQLKPTGKTAGLFAATARPNDAVEALLEKYANLIDKLSRIIMRYGVVLSTKGFNEYQVAEIIKQIQLEQELAPVLKKSI